MLSIFCQPIKNLNSLQNSYAKHSDIWVNIDTKELIIEREREREREREGFILPAELSQVIVLNGEMLKRGRKKKIVVVFPFFLCFGKRERERDRSKE